MAVDSDSEELRAAFQHLETRLTDLETRLRAVESTAPGAGAAGLVKDLHEWHAAEPRRAPANVEPTAAPVMITGAPEATIHPVAGAVGETETQPIAAAPAVPPVVMAPSHLPAMASETVEAASAPATPPPPPRPKNAASLESKIGKSWASWVGGLLVLVAVLLFMKLAWERGWLPGPGMRIALSLAAGAGLVILGQWAFRRKMGALAASLAATGLAVLMAAFFAANVAFAVPVLSRETAFAGVIVVGAGGIGMALEMGMMPLAILALLGMYLSPAVLGSREDHSLQLLVYVAIVTASGLALSFFRRRWGSLRGVAFCGGWLWVLFWATCGQTPDHLNLALAACAGFFAMYLAEITASVLRIKLPPDTPGQPNPARSQALVRQSSLALLSIVNTALTMIGFATVFSRTELTGLWVPALALAAIMAAVVPLTSSRAFVTAAGLQAMGLVALAVPLYFDGSAITIAWAVLGLVLAIYARLFDRRTARWWSLVMLGLVTVRICFFDSWDTSLHAAFIFAGEHITRWMLMGWAAAIYALLLGWLARPGAAHPNDPTGKPHRSDAITIAAAAIGTFLWCVICIAGLDSAGSISVMLLLWPIAVNGFARITVDKLRAPFVEACGMLVLLVTMVKWFLYDGVQLSVINAVKGQPTVLPFWNLFVLCGLLMVAAILLSRIARSGGPAFVAWWIAAIAFITLNIELLRLTDYWLYDVVVAAGGSQDPWILKNVVLSVLWGVVGLIAVLVGFSRHIAPLRWMALALLGATVAKVLLVDMANVGTVPRVLSFMAVGATLLLVSWIYHRVARREQQAVGV